MPSLHAGILFIIAYLTYFAKVGNRPPTLLRKIIALYAFNTAVVEVRTGSRKHGVWQGCVERAVSDLWYERKSYSAAWLLLQLQFHAGRQKSACCTDVLIVSHLMPQLSVLKNSSPLLVKLFCATLAFSRAEDCPLLLSQVCRFVFDVNRFALVWAGATPVPSSGPWSPRLRHFISAYSAAICFIRTASSGHMQM